ncbi:MAG: 30S ribosomal protein S9 [Deltaproteobacteria bacterium]|nr:30S ribosomal protein S9 [Deltaproteobacteria bacterium]
MAQETLQYYGTGRRKRSTARVYLRPGNGRIVINKREIDTYFPREVLKTELKRPFYLTETEDSFDAYINVRGGGHTGQAGAIRLGIARALIEYNPELRVRLKKEGMLTRDARKVERKKYGQPGARRRFQFSKR